MSTLRQIKFAKPKFLYMIKDGYWYKIRYSAIDPLKRMDILQCGNPRRLVMYAHKLLKETVFVEKLLHTEILKDKERFREWFCLSDEDARIVAEYIDDCSKL